MAFYVKQEGLPLGAGEFLAVGEPCIRKTISVSSYNEQVESYNGAAILKAGTVYPANDATAQGIIYEDVDVTYDNAPASLVVSGTVYSDLVDVSTAAKTALTGIKFVARPKVSRTGVIGK